MAQLKVLDQAAVLTTTLTNGEIARAEKYFPEALELATVDKDGERNVYFAISSCGHDVPPSDVSTYGVSFPTGKEDEQARVTIIIPKVPTSKKTTYVKDNFGKIVMNLKKVEAQYAEQRAAFDAEYAALDESIDVE